MKSDRTKSNPSKNSSGAGMSRAAKKRAKKKQKKTNAADDENNICSDISDSSHKGRKRPLVESSTEQKENENQAKEVESLANNKMGKNENDISSKRVRFGMDKREETKEQQQQQQQKQPKGVLKSNDELKYSKKISDDDDSTNSSDDDTSPAVSTATAGPNILNDDIVKFLQKNSEKWLLTDILLLKGNNLDEDSDEEDKVEEEEEKEQETKKQLERFSLCNFTSKQRACCALQYLMNMPTQDFYEKYWEKKPLCVQGNNESHRRRLDGFLSLQSIKDLLKNKHHSMFYGKDLNVTRYSDVPGSSGIKRRVTLDPTTTKVTKGKKKTNSSPITIDPKFVWTNFNDNGCSVRLLCPHKHNNAIHSLLSLLELEWGCMVGANAYLTPSNASQGFAPHYDDIEAFCLQLEGSKRWKVYPPPKGQKLPRASSEDFTEKDLIGIQPVLDVVLEPGDVLYMPRGWIHQACTLPVEDNDDNSSNKHHSLHLTVSAMQQWAWVDLLEIIFPEALESSARSTTSSTLRSGLPRGFLDYMGAMYDNIPNGELPDALKIQIEKYEKMKTDDDKDDDGDNQDSKKQEDEDKARLEELQRLQEQFLVEAKKRILRVAKEAMDMVHAACDQMGKRFLSERLPPGYTKEEASLTSKVPAADSSKQIWPSSLCRLSRPGIARLVLEDGKAIVYHCADNSRVYQEVPLSPLEFEMDDGPALEQLLRTVEPEWIRVQDLIHDEIEDKIAIAQSLFDEGILAIVNN